MNPCYGEFTIAVISILHNPSYIRDESDFFNFR
jgi:hypothetical protein